MNRKARMSITLVIVVSLAMVLATVAYARPFSENFSGNWVSTDIDGSYQELSLKGYRDGSAKMWFHDYGASICGLDASGLPYIEFDGRGRGTYDPATDSVSFDARGRCLTPHGARINYSVTFAYDGVNDALIDSAGVIWYRAP